MGVTFDHYKVCIRLDNDAKWPFNISEPIDIYLNPNMDGNNEVSIAYKLGLDLEDIMSIDYISKEESNVD